MLVSYKVCHGSLHFAGRGQTACGRKSGPLRSGRQKIQWRGEPHATVGGRYISLIQTARCGWRSSLSRPALESGRYIGKGLGGRSMLHGYNGKDADFGLGALKRRPYN